MSTSDISMITIACAAMLAALTHAIPRAVAGWRERTKAERVTADTVRGIFAAMERRVLALEAEHSTCLLSLAAVRTANAGLEVRITTLEQQVAAQSSTIARYERALATGEEERAELQRTIETGERRTLHRDASHVDAMRIDVTRTTTTEEP